MGRFIGGKFGAGTAPATANAPDVTGVYSMPDHYYMKEQGGMGNPASFSIHQYNVAGTPQGSTDYNNIAIGQQVPMDTAGRYVVTVDPNSPAITFQGFVWGGGGGSSGAPGPGGGAAGGGVRGEFDAPTSSTFTCFVGSGGPSGPGFPDGGSCTSVYFNAPGGGSSRIGHTSEGTIPHTGPGPTGHNFPSRVYFLIGGGGGGGSDYLTGGTFEGYGGYPAGKRGGAYYPSDPGADGRGGTQTAGGAGGPAGRRPAGNAGSKYQGGSSGTNGGGGGGGGYYGGGGAGGYYAQGGGGSSYIHPDVSNSASFDTTPGVDTFAVAVNDPGNPGLKGTNKGNGRQPGEIVIKVAATS